jgi:hypothetical protein
MRIKDPVLVSKEVFTKYLVDVEGTRRSRSPIGIPLMKRARVVGIGICHLAMRG